MTLAQKIAAAPRIFAIVYSGTVGKEAAIAKFPICVLSQTTSSSYSSASKDLMRTLNPNILLLGYQCFSEETHFVTDGPGEAIMDSLALGSPDAYMRDGPNGDDTGNITLNGGNGKKLFDYRKQVWQDGIIEALDAMLAAYPWDGFFFDNCTVFSATHPDASVRAQLDSSLRTFIKDRVRPRYPGLLLIGNSGDAAYQGLNGELNESRPNDYAAELPSSLLHSPPEVKLAHTLTSSNAVFGQNATSARQYGDHVFVAAGPDYNEAYWYGTHDRVAYERHGKPPGGRMTAAAGARK